MSNIDYTNPEIFAFPKPPKTEKKKRQPIVGKKHARTKKTDIPTKIKIKVWERDGHKCIFCDTYVEWNYANAHFIPRSQGGLGIVENIFTACDKCHREQDNGSNTAYFDKKAEKHLRKCYGSSWSKSKLIYKKT